MNETKSKYSTNYDSESADCLKKEYLLTISTLLQEIVDEQQDKKDLKRTIFYSKLIPEISIQSYLDRIIKYSNLETSTIIMTLIYIDRICEYNSLLITKHNVHRMLLSAMIVSIKVNEDDLFSNSFYAKVGGVSLQELNKLEQGFLSLIRFRLYIDINLFNKYQNTLLKYDKI